MRTGTGLGLILSLLLVFTVFGHAADPIAKRVRAAEVAKLQGVWKLIAVEDYDQSINFDDDKIGTYLLINGESCEFIDSIDGKNTFSPLAVKIDPTKEPKQMRVLALDADGKLLSREGTRQRPGEIEDEGWIHNSYRIDGDRLVWASFSSGHAFPTEFKAVKVKPTKAEEMKADVRITTFVKSKMTAADFKRDSDLSNQRRAPTKITL